MNTYMGPRRKTPPLKIVGVVKDTKYISLREKTQSIAYFPVAQAEALDDPRIFEILHFILIRAVAGSRSGESDYHRR